MINIKYYLILFIKLKKNKNESLKYLYIWGLGPIPNAGFNKSKIT